MAAARKPSETFNPYSGVIFIELFTLPKFPSVCKIVPFSPVFPTRLFHHKSRLGCSLILFRINLCTLELAAVINVDRFPLGEYIECLDAGITMAVTGSFCAAKWQMNFGTGCSSVHVNNACIQIALG